MKKYRVPIGLKYVVAFIYLQKGDAINHCVADNIPFDKIEEIDDQVFFMNELCKLKGHMWYCNKRKEVKKDDGIYSVCIEQKCARCGEIK